MKKINFILGLAFILIFFIFTKTTIGVEPEYKLLNNAQITDYIYAYAPAIIFKDNKYHVFFCSHGHENGITYTWDYIRYITSTDGITWSAPQIVLRAKANIGPNGKWRNYAACDPNILYDDGYYYLTTTNAYQTGTRGGLNLDNSGQEIFYAQSGISISRATNLTGPYQTYTERNTWETVPLDPKIIVKPLVHRSQQVPGNPPTTGYGVGQQTVIKKDGQYYMWVTDDSNEVDINNLTLRTFLRKSNNLLDWSTSQAIEIKQANGQPLRMVHSPDIKYDPATNRFVMLRIINAHQANSHLALYYSLDGITWTNVTILINQDKFPNFANNLGFSGNEYNNLISNQILVGFGAPYNLSPTDNWAHWSLYGVNLKLPNISDINNDGVVNVFDYNIIISNFGKTGNLGFHVADINSDGKINVLDYNLLIGSFGR